MVLHTLITIIKVQAERESGEKKKKNSKKKELKHVCI